MNYKITFIIAFFILSTLKAQTTFDWDTAPYNDDTVNNIVTQTLDGITTTFLGTANPGIVTGPGIYGDSGNVVSSSRTSNMFSTSVTFSFSEAVDVISILTISGPTVTYTFTPTGGSNSQVVEPVGNGGEIVNLNWTGVTSLVITGSTNFIVGFDNLIVTSSTLSNNNNTLENINIYPNPVVDFLYLGNVKNIKSARVYNSLGQLVTETKEEKIDLRNFKSGVYILQLNTDNQIINKRIIKK